jgi:hypothetical protein
LDNNQAIALSLGECDHAFDNSDRRIMKIETITYKRVKNLGNYQSETFEATATVEEGEEAHIVAEVLKAFVYEQLQSLPLTARFLRLLVLVCDWSQLSSPKFTRWRITGRADGKPEIKIRS